MQKQIKERPIVLPINILLPLMVVGLIVGLYILPHNTMMRILYMALTAIVLDEVYMLIIKRRLVFNVSLAKQEITKGEKVELSVTVQNKSFLPSPYIYIFLKTSYVLTSGKTKCYCVMLPSHGEKQLVIPYEGALSGKAEVGIEKIVLVDYFEMIRKKLKFTWQEERMILPQPVLMKEYGSSISFLPNQKQENQDLKRGKVGEVGYELAPYQEGQSERLIHWKLVAQRDIYMVREREAYKSEQEKRIVIINPIVKKEFIKRKLNQRFLSVRRYRFQLAQQLKQAKQEDYQITACLSYLNEVIKRREQVELYLFLDGNWKCYRIGSLGELETVKVKLIEAFMEESRFKTLLAQRWPEFEQADGKQQMLITTYLDGEVIDYLQLNQSLKVLVLQERVSKFKSNRCASLNRAYEIKSSLS